MPVIDQVISERYAIYNGDSAEWLSTLPDASVGLCLYSPPFPINGGGCLYRYSSSPRDLSNCRTYDEFFEHYDFILRELSRAMIPGRICAVHCTDVPKAGANIDGHIDFPGDLIRIHAEHGFEYTPRICIWKEPLEVRTRTMARALRHCQVVDDATLTNVAASDYLIPFRKQGKNPLPVTHEHGLTEYAGSREIPKDLFRFRGWEGDQKENRYSHWIWRQYASAVWDDIRLDRTVEFAPAREEEDDRHPHALQLDVIDRCVVMWSNPDETVLSPFMGVGSEVYGAVTNGRRGIGCELKPSYYAQAVENLKKAARPAEATRLLFDLTHPDAHDNDARRGAEHGALVGPAAEVRE